MRILGFGAHADDAEIFFLGLLLVYRDEGHEIGWMVATDPPHSNNHRENAFATRRAESIAAAATVDVEPIFLGLPDGQLEADSSTIALIEQRIVEFNPDLIVTHAPNDYHRDHRALSQAVVAAASYRAPVLFADTLAGVGAAPTIYVEISRHIAIKRRALQEHRSQNPAHLIYMSETQAAFRAMQRGLPAGNYVEAFSFEPTYKFTDIRALLPKAA